MALTRIDPLDFALNVVSTSTSCWRDANNNPLASFSTATTPGAGSETIYSGMANIFISNRSNVQYSTATADKNGSNTAKAIYGKLRNIVFGDNNAEFVWNGSSQPTFTVLSIARDKYKSALLPGSLKLGASTGYTDNSNMAPPQLFNCGRAYKLVQGSTTNGAFSYGVGTGEYGYVFPDIGIIIGSINFITLIASGFILKNEDSTPLNSVFIRARNPEYNYPSNPSFISGSSGIIIYPEWYENPQAYITTIGLYNDNNELLATAKLPRPYNKNFNNEALFQVNLNF